MKKIWITALEQSDQAAVQALMGQLKPLGLGAAGHFWTDDLAHFAWAGPGEELAHPDTGAWVILGSASTLARPAIRQGLALLALDIQSRKGPGFPIFLLGGPFPDLPGPLGDAQVLPPAASNLGVKLVAAAHRPLPADARDYRLALHVPTGLGLWFEVGPAAGRTWRGALFGLSDGSIDLHAVGPQGHLPQRTVLEYPMKGLELEAGGVRHTAWAVRNVLEAGQSYFLRVKDPGGSIVFGALPEEDQADLFRLQL